MFWNQWEYLGRVCFLKFFDWRHFWWSKGGVENRDGGGGEVVVGKRFLNCQMDDRWTAMGHVGPAMAGQ